MWRAIQALSRTRFYDHAGDTKDASQPKGMPSRCKKQWTRAGGNWIRTG
jgi:hypothetical protein